MPPPRRNQQWLKSEMALGPFLFSANFHPTDVDLSVGTSEKEHVMAKPKGIKVNALQSIHNKNAKKNLERVHMLGKRHSKSHANKG
jgi:hypothetical protein